MDGEVSHEHLRTLILGVEEMAGLAGDKVISSFIMLDVSEMDISRAGGRLLMFHDRGIRSWEGTSSHNSVDICIHLVEIDPCVV